MKVKPKPSEEIRVDRRDCDGCCIRVMGAHWNDSGNPEGDYQKFYLTISQASGLYQALMKVVEEDCPKEGRTIVASPQNWVSIEPRN